VEGERLMWAAQDTYSLSSSPADVWDVYTDVSVWSQWSPDIAWAEIDGPYAADAKGRMKFGGLPTTPWTVLAAEGPAAALAAGRGAEPAGKPLTFTSEVRVPFLLRMRFTHRLVGRGDSTDVTEGVSFHGVLAPLLGPILRRRWQRGWPTAMGDMGVMAYERAHRNGAVR